MFERPNGRERRRSTLASGSSGSVALVVAGLLLASACGGDAEPGAEAATAATTSTVPVASTTTTEPPVATTTVTPTTVRPSTTARPSTTTSTSTTTTAPLSTIALEHAEPVSATPIAPPADPHAEEPVVELGTLSIPKLGVEMTMYEGIRLTTLDRGPGHWPGSALPGQFGNVVVGGHRTSKHQVFRHVDQLAPGDEIVFTDAAGRHVYQVDRVEVVEPTDVWIVDPTETPTATLFACHPPGSTAQRIAVFADLAD